MVNTNLNEVVLEAANKFIVDNGGSRQNHMNDALSEALRLWLQLKSISSIPVTIDERAQLATYTYLTSKSQTPRFGLNDILDQSVKYWAGTRSLTVPQDFWGALLIAAKDYIVNGLTPIGVTTAGLTNTTWALQSTGCGLSNPSATFKNPVTDLTELNANGGTVKGSGVNLRVELATGDKIWTNWDWTGYIVAVESPSGTTQTFNNCKFAGSGLYALLFSDFNGNIRNPKIICNDCDFNSTGTYALDGNQDFIFNGPAYIKRSDADFIRCKFYGAQGPNYIVATGGIGVTAQVINVTDCYFRELASATNKVSQHCEYIHARTALGNINMTILRAFFDGRAGKGAGGGAMTGIINPEQQTGSGFDITWSSTDSIYLGATTFGSNWTIQTGGGTGRTNAGTLNNNVMEAGISGYCSKTGTATYSSTVSNKISSTGGTITLP